MTAWARPAEEEESSRRTQTALNRSLGVDCRKEELCCERRKTDWGVCSGEEQMSSQHWRCRKSVCVCTPTVFNLLTASSQMCMPRDSSTSTCPRYYKQRNSSLALKQWLRVSCSYRKRSRGPIYSCWNYRSGGRWHSMCGNSGALLYPRPSALVEDITASRPKDSWDWGQTKRRAAIVLTGSPSSSPSKTHIPQELLLSVCDISRVTYEPESRVHLLINPVKPDIWINSL